MTYLRFGLLVRTIVGIEPSQRGLSEVEVLIDLWIEKSRIGFAVLALPLSSMLQIQIHSAKGATILFFNLFTDASA